MIHPSERRKVFTVKLLSAHNDGCSQHDTCNSISTNSSESRQKHDAHVSVCSQLHHRRAGPSRALLAPASRLQVQKSCKWRGEAATEAIWLLPRLQVTLQAQGSAVTKSHEPPSGGTRVDRRMSQSLVWEDNPLVPNLESHAVV